MDKPRTFNGDLNHLPAALERLSAERRWLVWRWEARHKKSGELDLDKNGDPKWTKPPYQARFPKHHAATDDPSTWGIYLDAVAAVKVGEADGIGYALLGSDLGAIDLDKCRNAATGEVAQWAEELHAEAGGAYHEITVSGQGTRILGITNGPSRQRRFNLGNGAGIELFRNTKKYITISANERGACAGLPPIDDLIDTLEERYDAQKDCKRASPAPFDFNTAAPQGRDYDDLIRNGAPNGERSELFHGAVWHLAGKGWTAEEITDELARYPTGIGVKYASRLHAEVSRSYHKWRGQRRSNATGCNVDAAPWPQICVVPGELPRVVNEAESALLGLDREIYQRGGMIVRPVLTPVATFHDQETEAWRLLEVSRGHLAETLARAAQWIKYESRRKKWVTIDVPGLVIEAYQGRVGEWKLPVLTGVTGTPQLRGDGSLHDVPGYDPISGLLYKPEREFDLIPEHPTKDDALTALRLFDDLLGGFPFVKPKEEDELEKRLNSELLAGASIICIDNCEHPLQSAFLWLSDIFPRIGSKVPSEVRSTQKTSPTKGGRLQGPAAVDRSLAGTRTERAGHAAGRHREGAQVSPRFGLPGSGGWRVIAIAAMSLFRPRRRLTAEERHALQMLASSRSGCSQSIMPIGVLRQAKGWPIRPRKHGALKWKRTTQKYYCLVEVPVDADDVDLRICI
jgi:hypothetical protein